MKFDRLFRSLSYAAVFCGFLSLWVTGTFSSLAAVAFIAIMAAAWFAEGSRWQLGERSGTVLIVLAIPVFYLFWRYRLFDFSSTEAALPGLLARMILTLTAIKLLQRKTDRDWIFLYVMAFFEVLLAAGMSISALYLASFLAFAIVMVCTIVIFEVRKTDDAVSKQFAEASATKGRSGEGGFAPRRLPVIAMVLIFAIVAIAAPMFFALPRVGGAGIGGGQGGLSTSSGFSDSVKLGGIGRIQQNDEVVMRVRFEDRSTTPDQIRWRGIALDTFDNQAWRRSRAAFREVRERDERDLIQVDYLAGRESLSVQTFYLEPLDSPVLFVLPRAIGVQSNFPILFRDTHGSLSFQRTGERITYKVISDTAPPDVARLRSDAVPYTYEDANYLQLPNNFDPRISELAADITGGTRNRYDAAAAVERYLQTQFGYTLEQKAGGDEPLADFLFNVREGHCEYFATAMAVMLRTQGIATRVVNGFQQGEYNETADVFVVRQREAHSWVEVYFPGDNVWVAFDPTPFAGRSGATASSGITEQIGKYLEALEMFWIQYFVAFDDQEQRSLFTSFRRGIASAGDTTSEWTNDIRQLAADWWERVRGDHGSVASLTMIGYSFAGLVALALLGFLIFEAYRKVIKLKIWHALRNRFFRGDDDRTVEFYERMQAIFARRGVVRKPSETPLEFAFALGVPEAVSVTEKYNNVRFGGRGLSPDEEAKIDAWLDEIEQSERVINGRSR